MSTTLASKCTLAGAAGGASPRRAASARPIIAPVVDLLATWFERARQRRQLQGLDDRMLQDLGLSRADVDFEWQKRFWVD